VRRAGVPGPGRQCSACRIRCRGDRLLRLPGVGESIEEFLGAIGDDGVRAAARVDAAGDVTGTVPGGLAADGMSGVLGGPRGQLLGAGTGAIDGGGAASSRTALRRHSPPGEGRRAIPPYKSTGRPGASWKDGRHRVTGTTPGHWTGSGPNRAVTWARSRGAPTRAPARCRPRRRW